jgi:hypothetical protein
MAKKPLIASCGNGFGKRGEEGLLEIRKFGLNELSLILPMPEPFTCQAIVVKIWKNFGMKSNDFKFLKFRTLKNVSQKLRRHNLQI